MDWTVYPGSPISRLPRLLQYPALLVRNLLAPLGRFRQEPSIPAEPSSPYTFNADGLATAYYSPFLDDREWSSAYEAMATEWYPDKPGLDLRWRMWILTSVARQTRELPGNVAEFGVYRGGCARMVLGTAGIAPEREYHLFDTFEGLPDGGLTERERREGYAGLLADTSAGYVEELLSEWRHQLVFHVGDVFETLAQADTGGLALVHMDLNASEPTRVATDYAYERLVPGGVIVFDDYGWGEDYEQRDVIHEICNRLPESLVALPSGQALLTKLPT